MATAPDSSLMSGVFVVGSHRSGTSAATRVVNLLGVPTAAGNALKRPSRWNEAGFWEVGSLSRFNEEILSALGGSWQAPPDLAGPWTQDGRMEPFRDRARELFAAAHPSPEWVWKDPRNCLLLPFWLEVLDARPSVVFVHRDPLEVAASLVARDRVSPQLGLAIWERYTRSALRAVAGLPVIVVPYDALLASPMDWRTKLLEFLGDRGLDCSRAAPASEVVRFLDPGLRHQRPENGPSLSDEQRALVHVLADLPAVSRRSAAPQLPPETPMTTALLDDRRIARGLVVNTKQLRKLRTRIENLDALLAAGISGSAAVRAKENARDGLRDALTMLDVVLGDAPPKTEPAEPHRAELSEDRAVANEVARRLAGPVDRLLTADPDGGYSREALSAHEHLTALHAGGVLDDLGAADGRLVIWEISSGSGGLAYRIKQLFPDTTLIISDPGVAGLRASSWLKSACPTATFAFLEAGQTVDLERTDFVFAAMEDVAALTPPPLDLVIAAGSLGGIPLEEVERHVALAHDHGGRYLYVATAAEENAIHDLAARWYWPHAVQLPKLLQRGAAARHVVGWRRVKR